MSVDSSQSGLKSVLSARRYRRTDTAVLPFFPYGLVPVLGLAALLLFGWMVLAVTAVQGAARAAAERALEDAGEGWVKVRASGQWITLEGTPPSADAGERAVAAVRQATSHTWLGQARPVTRVKANFAATAQANSITTSPAEPADPEFLFRLTTGTLTLNGRVPTETLRKSLGDRAEALKSPGHLLDVINRMTVTNGYARSM
jgi:OOP family OmpA-OmpF porin